MIEEMEFPITRDDCPHCQCKERLGQETISGLIEQGKLSKGLYPEGLMMQVPLVDNKRITAIFSPTVKIPVIVIYWDICKECMTMYCNKFNLIMQEVPVKMQKMTGDQPPQQFSPS